MERRSAERVIVALVLATAAFVSTPSLVGASEASVLFEKGRRELERGETDRACVTLAESDRLEPTVASVGLLAACHERQGRLATAMREYRETARRAEAANDERAEFARKRADRLVSEVPRLTVRVPKDEALTVKVNGTTYGLTALTDLTLDPGTVEIVAEGPARREPWKTTVILSPRRVTEITIPKNEAKEIAPLPEAGRPWWPALASGAVGVVGLGVGGALAGVAASANDASLDDEARCRRGESARCDVGREHRDDARQLADGSTALFIVGGAASAFAIGWSIYVASEAPADEPIALPTVVVTDERVILGLSRSF